MADAELRAENERLKAELERVSARLKAVENPPEGELTISSLAAKLEGLSLKMEKQGEQIEAKLEEMLGERGSRNPPPSALAMGETMRDMEGLGMTDQQLLQAKELFDVYDADSTGVIETGNVINLLRLLGECPRPGDVERMIAEVDQNKNGDMTLSEFLSVYAQTVKAQVESRHVVPYDITAVSFYGVGALVRWVKHEGDQVGGNVTGDSVPAARRMARRMLISQPIENCFYFCILLSAANSGMQTYAEYENSDLVVWTGHFSNTVFAVECILKLVADGSSCAATLDFFKDPWNAFDIMVLIALLILTLATAGGDGTGVGAVRVVRILRLLRALRILRAARIFPQLSLVLETLIRSTTSVLYIMAFMLLIAYIFAIVAVTVFGTNDPFNFGTLGRAMTTLFRVATREGWATIMYFQLYGCDGWGEGYETYVRNTARFIHQPDDSSQGVDSSLGCVHEEFPIFGRIFFGFYLFLAGFLLINLFVGVICDSMMQQQRENDEKAEEDKAWLVATRLAHLSDDVGGDSTGSPTSTLGKGIMFEEEDVSAKRTTVMRFSSPLADSS